MEKLKNNLCCSCKKILVIDDDLKMLDTIRKQLRGEKFDLKCIDNPIAAFHLINSEEYDVVICDFKMKPIDGLETLKKIKTFRPSMNVIIITGYFNEEIKKQAAKYGTSHILSKPILKKDLIFAIQNLPAVF